MKCLSSGLFACALAATAAAESPHVTDPARLLPRDSAWPKAAEAELTAFERTSGIRILVEFHLTSPPAGEDRVPGAYMSARSRKLGTLQHGVLVVYFADDPDWRVWVGEELTAKFVGKPGSTKELTESGAIHDTKEAMLAAARGRADAACGELQKAGRPATRAQTIVIQADALLGQLMEKLGAKWNGGNVHLPGMIDK